jgi:putative membrane protein
LPDGLPSDAQDLQQKLSSEQGKQFEKDYMSGMVEDHQKDVQEFQDASQNLKDSDLKQWAGTMLPKLQQHLAKAQAVDSKLNGKASSSSSGASL